MEDTVDQTVARILTWPSRWRAFLAEVLIESLDREQPFEVSSAWQDEIQRRTQQIDEGTVARVAAEDVLAEMRALTR